MEKEVDVKEKNDIEKVFSKRNRIAVVFLAMIIFILLMFISVRGEFLRYQEIGENFIKVFEARIRNEFTVFSTAFVIIFAVIFITNKISRKGLAVFFKEENKKMPKLLNKTLAFIIAIIGSVVAVNMLSTTFAEFVNGAWFGKSDPIFANDIGEYLFKIPFIQEVLAFIMGFLVFLIAYIAVYYVVSFNRFFDGIDVETVKNSMLVKQVITCVILFTICLCVSIFVSSETILTQEMVTIEDDLGTDLIGANKTDIIVKVWGYRILSVIIFVAVLRILKFVKKANFKQCVISAAIVPVYMVGLFIVMLGFSLAIGGNELEVEREFIAYNIENTKDAYGINIDQVDISEYKTITYDEIKNNQNVIKIHIEQNIMMLLCI